MTATADVVLGDEAGYPTAGSPRSRAGAFAVKTMNTPGRTESWVARYYYAIQLCVHQSCGRSPERCFAAPQALTRRAKPARHSLQVVVVKLRRCRRFSKHSALVPCFAGVGIRGSKAVARLGISGARQGRPQIRGDHDPISRRDTRKHNPQARRNRWLGFEGAGVWLQLRGCLRLVASMQRHLGQS